MLDQSLQSQSPRSLWFAGVRRVGPGTLDKNGIGLREGRLTDTAPRKARQIDASDLWALPGIIDLHGDGFERHLAPRRGVVTDLESGIRATETELASVGISTAWLAQFWSWEGGMRSPDFAERLATTLCKTRPETRLDLRMQLRFETHMIEDIFAVRKLIQTHGIDYLVFNDHLPHEHLEDGRTPPRHTGSSIKAGRSPEAHLDVMTRLHAQSDQVPNAIANLAEALFSHNIRMASHDDTDAKTRQFWHNLGVTISEFPVTQEAHATARSLGNTVLMGAPNVIRSRSHKRGGMSADPLIATGGVDALTSDYYYPSLAASAFKIADRGHMSLDDAWALISSRPAEIMGLSDRGRLQEGLRGDLILLDPKSRVVEATFAAGRPVFISGKMADRMLTA